MIGSGCILRIHHSNPYPKWDPMVLCGTSGTLWSMILRIHHSNPYPKWDPMVWVIFLSPLISSYQLTDKKIDFFLLLKLKNPGTIPSSLNHGDLKNIYICLVFATKFGSLRWRNDRRFWVFFGGGGDWSGCRRSCSEYSKSNRILGRWTENNIAIFCYDSSLSRYQCPNPNSGFRKSLIWPHRN